MKTYYYGNPTSFYPEFLLWMSTHGLISRWIAILIAVIVWCVVLIPCYFLIKIGNIGHIIAYSLGYESRDW